MFLSGVHVGCQELVAIGRIRSVRDLKGKTVVAPVGGVLNSIVAVMLGHVGLDYRKDVNFVEKTPAEAIQLLPKGRSTPTWPRRRSLRSSARRRSAT